MDNPPSNILSYEFPGQALIYSEIFSRWLQVPAVFCLNLTIPVVDYDEEEHNWNKWLNVLHCLTMPVFGVVATNSKDFLSHDVVSRQDHLWTRCFLLHNFPLRSSYNILGEFFIMWLSATPPDLWIEETFKRYIVPTEQVSSTRYRPLAKKKTKP